MNLRTTSIVHLLLTSCPSAITWRVVAIVVDTVKAGSRRTRSHIFVKCHEVAAPRLFHPDTSSAIASICLVLCVVAPIFSTAPRTILHRREIGTEVPATVPVFMSPRRSCILTQQATATLNGCVSQVAAPDYCFFSALTQTDPHRGSKPAVTFRPSDNSQTVDNLPDHVNRSHILKGLFYFSYDLQRVWNG